MIELAILNIAISVDSLLISLLIGRQTKSIKHTLLRPLIFALVQGLLVLIGYFFGREILKYIFHFDHWLIFGSFTFLATKQFFENSEPQIKVRNIWLQSVLTSLDGLLIGFSLSMENHSLSSIIIFSLVITYLLSLLGISLGKKSERLNSKRINKLGAILLFSIGSKILIEHLLRHYY